MSKLYRHIRSTELGFTLIELMIVIAIMGILAAVAMTVYRSNINSAKCTEAEVPAHDTMLALIRELADSGTAPPPAGFANTHVLPSGETLTYPANVQVSYSGNGTQANPFVVNSQRTNPICNKGDGTYTLIQGNTRGVW